MAGAFTHALGVTQGRIDPENATPELGNYAMCLGDDKPGRLHRLLPNDSIKVEQEADFTGVGVARFHAYVRPPSSVPATGRSLTDGSIVTPSSAPYWMLVWELSDTDGFSRIIRPGEPVYLSDIALNAGLLGQTTRTVSVRLVFVSPTPGVYEAELPAIYLNPLILDDASDRLVITNRNPEPGESNVPANTTITFLVMDVIDVGVTPGCASDRTSVYINGQLAYLNGLFQPGFDGGLSEVEPVNTGVHRFTIQPTAPFSSQEQVEVRVQTVALEESGSASVTYSFTIADTTAPTITGAVANAHRRVDVSFSETVKQVSSANTDDALNPRNYVLTSSASPVFLPTVVSVEALTSTKVRLHLSDDLTISAIYEVTVSNVEDAKGNVVVAPDDHATFLGYACPRPSTRTFDLYRMLPRVNRRDDETGTGDLRKFLALLQGEVDLMLCRIDAFSDIFDVDLAEERYLDLMLVGLGNPFAFIEGMSTDDKRRLIKVLVTIYKQKGTGPGIVNAIRFFLGIESTVKPYGSDGWVLGESELGIDTYLHPSTLFLKLSFDVEVYRILTSTERTRLRKIVLYMKPAWEHFIRLIEPETPVEVDHVELGLSEVGETFILH